MLRAIDRREREDRAPRLKHEVSTLSELYFEIEEVIAGSSTVASRHVRRIVVDTAPALFEIQCSEAKCNDGGHDLTASVMRALHAHLTEFRGEHACYGRLGTGSGSCDRVLHYVAHAKYKPR
jgi:hypothetical protein